MRKTLLTPAVLLLAGTLAFAAGEGEGAMASDEVVTLTMFGGLNPRITTLDSPENEYTLWMEEKFGVKIEWVAVPNQERKQKQNLLLASGDYPEIFWAGDFNNAEQMRYGGEGVLQPLNDLIAQAPDILAAFEFKPYFRPEITTPDGNIYTLPHFEECYHCSVRQKLWMNTTWLDTLGLEMPDTTEDLENVLLAFKDQDPNGNGEADEIPLTGATGTWSADVYDYPMNPFIYNDGSSYLYMNHNKEVDFNANKPEWRDGLAYMRRLYSLGLIDPQAFTQNLDAARAVTNAEPYVVGSYTAGHNRMFPRNDDLWPQYRAVPPLMGPTGLRQTAYWPSGVDRGKFAITNKASDAQARKAMEMANYAYTEEGTIREIWGIPVNSEGVVNWRYAKEGELGLNGKPGIVWGAPHAWGDTPRKDAWMMELIFWHFDLFNGWVADQDITKVEGYERFLVLESDKYIPHVPTPEMRVPIGRGTSGGLYFPEEVAQRIAQIQAEVQTYVRQNQAAFITGQKNLDTEWDAYVAGLDALGIQEYVSTFQEAMDAAAALQ